MTHARLHSVSRSRAASSVTAAALAVFLANTVLRADDLILQGMSPQRVTVTDFKDGRLIYQTDRGGRGERPYDKVKQLVLDGETALDAADATNASGRPQEAVDDYVKALRATPTRWVRAYAARRLLDAIGDSPKFEPRLAAYLGLLESTPADADAHKPPLPDRGSRLLDVAVADAETALKSQGLPDGATPALLTFLIDLHRQRGDDAAVAATVERLAKSSPAAANDPAVRSQVAGLKIAQARLALDQKDYAGAVRMVRENAAMLTDPRQQSDALFVLAAAAEATADPTDKTALSDAALAYMRVVARADDLDGRPDVLPALRATAGILERTGNKADATKIDTQIVQEFAGDPAAVSQANADLARLARP